MDTLLYDFTNLWLLTIGVLLGLGLALAYHFRQRDLWQRDALAAELRAEQTIAAKEKMKEHWRSEATHWAAEAQRLQAALDGASTYTPALRWPRPLGQGDRRVG